jgi:hypothetical protein
MSMRAVPTLLLLGAALAVCTAVARAQEDAPAPRDAAPESVIRPGSGEGHAEVAPIQLAPQPFESLALGVSLRPPADSKVIRQVGGEEVDFIHQGNKWNLKVARMILQQPMPLETTTDDQGVRHTGLLEVTLDRQKDQLPGAHVLRHDVIRIGEADVGMIALRYVNGLEPLLSQQALVRQSDRTYFVITLTSSGSKAAGKEPGNDPAERLAVETFGEVLDTIHLLDQAPLVRDQEERLYATRALFVNLGGKDRLKRALVPQQWLRLLRNGKDVGYIYTVEETADGIPGDDGLRRKKPGARRGADDGILIGSRSRTMAGEDARLDAESWLFTSTDRRAEQWSSLQVVQSLKDPAQQDHATTLGSSTRRTGRSLDRRANQQGMRWDADDPNQPPVRETDDYVLNVTHIRKSENAEPLTQGLPEWYIPQALSHLMPRLLPLEEPKKFMFAVYVPDVRKVMHRYMDVGGEKRITFGGENIRAVPITDRIGLEGSVTTHYMSLTGQYIGSENADTGIAIMPTDEAKLLEIWKDANLTRPGEVKNTQSTERKPAPESAPAKPVTADAATGVDRKRPSGR